jgi:hypothetical protein
VLIDKNGFESNKLDFNVFNKDQSPWLKEVTSLIRAFYTTSIGSVLPLGGRSNVYSIICLIGLTDDRR